MDKTRIDTGGSRKYNRFGTGGCFTCRLCGKKTRDTGDNGSLELCVKCMRECERDNYHNDNGHKGDAKTCQICKEEGV